MMQNDWHNENDDDSDDYDEAEQPISKSQIKRDLQALKELGRELIELPAHQLEKLDLDASLYEAVLKAQNMQKGALKRQTGFIGGLIANSDYEAIRKQLETLRQPQREATQKHHQIEVWRDRLLSGDTQVMTELHNRFEDFDGQYVRQLVQNAKRESLQNKAPKSARLLFKYLQQISD